MIRLLMIQVYEPTKWIESLDQSDPCWELFTCNSILSESRYLSRAVTCLRAAAGCGERKQIVNAQFKELYSSLKTIDSDVSKASDFVRGTIDMVS
jgi:hypothetical protein